MLFIDGEFWGMYEIMEKSSAYFFETNYGLPEENIALMKNYIIEEGEDADFNEFKKYHDKNSKYDFKDPEVYKEICSIIDVESMELHYALGIYIGIWDWPNYNLMVWKYKGEKIEGNPYSDGRYRFGSFDFDWSCGAKYDNYDINPQYNYWTHLEEKKTGYPTTIFVSLLKNEESKQLFLGKFKYLAEEIFSTEEMDKIVDELENNLMEYLVLNVWRWENHRDTINFDDSYHEARSNTLKEDLEKLRNFFKNRGKYAIQQTMNYLGV